MIDLDYEVIATGSSGNAVRIEDILIDCGIPYKDLRETLYKVDTLLITHSHTDHVKDATLERIQKEFPHIKTYANYDVAYRYDIDTVVSTEPVRLKRKRIIIPFPGAHNVPVTGFVIKMKGLVILYMTDSSKVEPPEGLVYDYVFLESNYDERKIKELSKKYKRKGYDPYTDSLTRHLSTQKCKEFYYVNRRSEESVLVELHQSSRFY